MADDLLEALYTDAWGTKHLARVLRRNPDGTADLLVTPKNRRKYRLLDVPHHGNKDMPGCWRAKDVIT